LKGKEKNWINRIKDKLEKICLAYILTEYGNFGHNEIGMIQRAGDYWNKIENIREERSG
jgi:hypothetical protein